MIDLPDFDKAFEYEDNFYLSCRPIRLAKILAHYELFRMIKDVSGAIVECGVFKGTSFARWAMFRKLFGIAEARQLIGFDTFSEFPVTEREGEAEAVEKFIAKAGSNSISAGQMREVLSRNSCCTNTDLIEGDICTTVPQYVADHPELSISLLNLDVDMYAPSVTILEHLWPLIVPGGIMLLDDYGVFPGETTAAREYFGNDMPNIKKLSFSSTPCYIVKD